MDILYSVRVTVSSLFFREEREPVNKSVTQLSNTYVHGNIVGTVPGVFPEIETIDPCDQRKDETMKSKLNLPSLEKVR